MKNLPYWITTGLFTFGLGASGLMTITHQPPMVAAYQHLGYPLYFMNILGAGKLLGVATVLAPGLPRLKEWAYAGFVINMTSAVISHLASGDPVGNAVGPFVILGLVLASWRLRPADRKLADAPATA